MYSMHISSEMQEVVQMLEHRAACIAETGENQRRERAAAQKRVDDEKARLKSELDRTHPDAPALLLGNFGGSGDGDGMDLDEVRKVSMSVREFSNAMLHSQMCLTVPQRLKQRQDFDVVENLTRGAGPRGMHGPGRPSSKRRR